MGSSCWTNGRANRDGWAKLKLILWGGAPIFFQR